MTDPNPAVAAMAELADEIADNWPDTPAGWWSYTNRHALADAVVAHLFASPEALRWLGQHVDPEALGYEVSKRWTAEPVYLAPRREETT